MHCTRHVTDYRLGDAAVRLQELKVACERLQRQARRAASLAGSVGQRESVDMVQQATWSMTVAPRGCLPGPPVASPSASCTVGHAGYQRSGLRTRLGGALPCCVHYWPICHLNPPTLKPKGPPLTLGPAVSAFTYQPPLQTKGPRMGDV